MTIALMGLVTALNFIIIMIKFKVGRTEDAGLDLVLLITVFYVTSGSLAGMQIGMIGSFVISAYLYFSKQSLFKKRIV
mgnify:FL=1